MPHATLRIAQPCAESWAAMTPTAAGRHCAACQKTVVDFTLKIDAEILAYFAQAGTGKTCGRFRMEQLGKSLSPVRSVGKPLHWQLWLAGLLTVALSVQSCQSDTKELAPTTPRHRVPLLIASAGDSATRGANQALIGDSVAVGAAREARAELNNILLGEPVLQ